MQNRTPGVKHIKHQDGSVWSENTCECGKLLYKKDLRNDRIQMMVGGRSESPQFTYIEIPGNPSQISITCPQCKMKILIASYSEIIQIQ